MDDKKNRIFACLVMAVLMLTIGIYAYEGSRESVIVTQTGDSIKWVDKAMRAGHTSTGLRCLPMLR